MKVIVKSFSISTDTVHLGRIPRPKPYVMMTGANAEGILAIAGQGELPMQNIRLTDEERDTLVALARQVGERIDGEIRKEAEKFAPADQPAPVGDDLFKADMNASNLTREPVPQQ